jgi:hypothetical protein
MARKLSAPTTFGYNHDRSDLGSFDNRRTFRPVTYNGET